MYSGPLIVFAVIGSVIWLILLPALGVFVDSMRMEDREVVMDRERNMAEHPVMEILFRFMVFLYVSVPIAVLLAGILYAFGK